MSTSYRAANLNHPFGNDNSGESESRGRANSGSPGRRAEDQQRERTNASGLDDYRTEGNVVEVRCDTAAPPIDDVQAPNDVPYLVIATRDGNQQLRLLGETRTQCPSARVGDYAEADGTKQNEQLFDADNLTLTTSGGRFR